MSLAPSEAFFATEDSWTGLQALREQIVSNARLVLQNPAMTLDVAIFSSTGSIRHTTPVPEYMAYLYGYPSHRVNNSIPSKVLLCKPGDTPAAAAEQLLKRFDEAVRGREEGIRKLFEQVQAEIDKADDGEGIFAQAPQRWSGGRKLGTNTHPEGSFVLDESEGRKQPEFHERLGHDPDLRLRWGHVPL